MRRLEEGRQKVFEFDWATIPNPFEYAADGTTLEQLSDKLIQKPNSAEAVYRKFNTRGMVQILFRKTLLKAYNSRCAFCELSFPEALEAAHIVGWTVASDAQRIDITNGLLLCATHHQLFDYGLMTLTRSFRIAYADPRAKHGPYTKADLFASIRLHGLTARLPKSDSLKPSLAALAHHHRMHEWDDLP